MVIKFIILCCVHLTMILKKCEKNEQKSNLKKNVLKFPGG